MAQMQTIIKALVVLVKIIFVVEILLILLAPVMLIGMGIGGYHLYKRIKQNKKMKSLALLEKNKDREWKESIDYKMEKLLEMAHFDIHNSSKRTAYKTKPQLNLLDQWYKYIDLRAKLHLNNTSTSREESVLHLMCDEVLSRIQYAEIVVTDDVRKEFIIENVSPLLHDILDIMEGIRPTDSISIDAYQLLSPSKNQEELLFEQLNR